jgi:hypothetical protein
MLLQNDVDRDKLGEKAFEVIAHNQGAINKSMEAIERFL